MMVPSFSSFSLPDSFREHCFFNFEQHSFISLPPFIRLNDRILSTKSSSYVDMTGESNLRLSAVSVEEFSALKATEMTSIMTNSFHYLSTKSEPAIRPLTVWIVADFDTEEGRELFLEAIKYLVSCVFYYVLPLSWQVSTLWSSYCGSLNHSVTWKRVCTFLKAAIYLFNCVFSLPFGFTSWYSLILFYLFIYFLFQWFCVFPCVVFLYPGTFHCLFTLCLAMLWLYSGTFNR